MPDNNFRMAFDFFFTDIPNHLEFLKWTRGLGRDDDILLVAALEAMHLHYFLQAQEERGGLVESGNAARSIQVNPPIWLNTDHALGDSTRLATTLHDTSLTNHHEQQQQQQRTLQRGQSAGLGATSDREHNTTTPTNYVIKPMLDSKHPFNLIECYADLRKLDGHEYNIIEYAYLEGGWRNYRSIWELVPSWSRRWWSSPTNKLVWTAIISCFSQVLFSLILYIWHFFTKPPVIYERDEPYAFQLVAIVAIISTIVFANIALKQVHDALDFNSNDGGAYWTSHVGASEFAYWFGKALLMVNFLVNVILAPPLVVFNLYFVMTSEAPVDAILNAVALGFVLEVDDLLAPSWDDDMTENAKAKLFHEYISEPFPGTVDEDFLHMRFTRITPCDEIIPYKDGDKLYIKVPEKIDEAADSFHITVFRSNSDFEGGYTPTDSYQTIHYRISGPTSYITVFHEKVRNFYCVQNYDDFKLHVEMIETVEALRRKRT